MCSLSRAPTRLRASAYCAADVEPCFGGLTVKWTAASRTVTLSLCSPTERLRRMDQSPSLRGRSLSSCQAKSPGSVSRPSCQENAEARASIVVPLTIDAPSAGASIASLGAFGAMRYGPIGTLADDLPKFEARTMKSAWSDPGRLSVLMGTLCAATPTLSGHQCSPLSRLKRIE